MHDFWFGFFVGFVVLTILCVIGVCCIVVGSRSERSCGARNAAGGGYTSSVTACGRATFPSRGRLEGCGGGCDAVRRDELIARVCKERDGLKKENESLRQRVTVLMAEREIGKTAEPKNTYEELERSWEKV